MRLGLFTSVVLFVTSIRLYADSADAPIRLAAPKVHAENAMVIEGPIMGRNLSQLETAFLKKGAQDTVDLVINSPGGSVTTGLLFISIMDDARSRGVTINCFVPQVAASMAFQILLHCDTRTVLSKSFLLWHRARVFTGEGTPMTAPMARDLSYSLQRLDNLIFKEVKRYIDMPEHALRYHFEQETLHVGEQVASESGNTFTAVDSVEGLYEALNNNKLPRSQQQISIFGFLKGELIYITNNPVVASINSSWFMGE